MFSRLTALVLSWCIALPVCWCCVPAQVETAVKSCCMQAEQSSHSQEQAPQDRNCPCARHEASRDLAGSPVKAPMPDLRLLVEPVWQTVSLRAIFPVTDEISGARHDHGPPLSTVPAYARHCALLL